MDFEAHAISASDSNGIKKLLQQVCDISCTFPFIGRSGSSVIPWLWFVCAAVFKSPREHIRADRPHHSTESHRKCHQGEFFETRSVTSSFNSPLVGIHFLIFVQQAEVPEDSDDDDPDEVFGFITMLNLTERKVRPLETGISAVPPPPETWQRNERVCRVSDVGRACSAWRR